MSSIRNRNRNRSDVIFFKLEHGWTHLGMVMETVYKKADSRIRFYLFFLDFNMIFHLFPGFFCYGGLILGDIGFF